MINLIIIMNIGQDHWRVKDLKGIRKLRQGGIGKCRKAGM